MNCLDTALQVVVGSLDAWICQDDTAVISTMQVITDDRIEKETLAMMEPSKLMKKKVDISDGVRKKKFVFNTKGKLTKKEVVELKRTHNKIFDWVAKEQNKQAEQSKFEEMVNLWRMPRSTCCSGKQMSSAPTSGTGCSRS